MSAKQNFIIDQKNSFYCAFGFIIYLVHIKAKVIEEKAIKEPQSYKGLLQWLIGVIRGDKG
jgi:hypothetical protein